MPITDEIVPDTPVIEEVIKVALLPVIHRCEEELSESLAANLAVVSNGIEVHPVFIQGTRQGRNDTPRGTIRLIFRKTFNPNRYRFQIEAIYPDLEASKDGFSGFLIGGDVKLEEENIRVKSNSGMYRHNCWEWQG